MTPMQTYVDPIALMALLVFAFPPMAVAVYCGTVVVCRRLDRAHPRPRQPLPLRLRWDADGRSEVRNGLRAVVSGSKEGGYTWRICDGTRGREWGVAYCGTKDEAKARAEGVLIGMAEYIRANHGDGRG